MPLGFDIKILRFDVFNYVYIDVARLPNNDGVLKGGIFSVINNDNTEIFRDGIQGNISISVLGEKLIPDDQDLHVIFRSDLVSDFKLDSSTSIALEPQKLTGNENLRIKLEEIYGGKTLTVDLFRDVSREPRIISGSMDISITVFSFAIESAHALIPKISTCLSCKMNSECILAIPTKRTIGLDTTDMPTQTDPTDAGYCSDDSSNGSLENFIDSFNTKFGYTTKKTQIKKLEPVPSQYTEIPAENKKHPEMPAAQDLVDDVTHGATTTSRVSSSTPHITQIKQKTNTVVNYSKSKRSVTYHPARQKSSHIYIQPAPTRFILSQQNKEFYNNNKLKTVKSESFKPIPLHADQMEFNDYIPQEIEEDVYRRPVTASAVKVLFSETEATNLGIILKEEKKSANPLIGKDKYFFASNLNSAFKQPPIEEPECMPLFYQK